MRQTIECYKSEKKYVYKEITTSRFKNRKSIVSYQVIHLISIFWRNKSKYLVKSEIRKGLLWQVFHLVDFVVPLHKTQITMVFTSSRYRGLIRKDQFESVYFWRATYFICTDAERIITWSFLASRGAFNNYVDKIRWVYGSKCAYFCPCSGEKCAGCGR